MDQFSGHDMHFEWNRANSIFEAEEKARLLSLKLQVLELGKNIKLIAQGTLAWITDTLCHTVHNLFPILHFSKLNYGLLWSKVFSHESLVMQKLAYTNMLPYKYN